jgi:hypothetical protein
MRDRWRSGQRAGLPPLADTPRCCKGSLTLLDRVLKGSRGTLQRRGKGKEARSGLRFFQNPDALAEAVAQCHNLMAAGATHDDNIAGLHEQGLSLIEAIPLYMGPSPDRMGGTRYSVDKRASGMLPAGV